MITENEQKIHKIRVEDNQKLLNNINELFAKRNVKKKEFKTAMADRYSDIYITKVFSGSREITDEFLDSICAFFKVDRSEVIKG
jgi:hypothetical protein